jgi:hypothetical protein
VILLDLRSTTFLDLVPVSTDHREGVFLLSERGVPQAECNSVPSERYSTYCVEARGEEQVIDVQHMILMVLGATGTCSQQS